MFSFSEECAFYYAVCFVIRSMTDLKVKVYQAFEKQSRYFVWWEGGGGRGGRRGEGAHSDRPGASQCELPRTLLFVKLHAERAWNGQ